MKCKDAHVIGTNDGSRDREICTMWTIGHLKVLHSSYLSMLWWWRIMLSKSWFETAIGGKTGDITQTNIVEDIVHLQQSRSMAHHWYWGPILWYGAGFQQWKQCWWREIPSLGNLFGMVGWQVEKVTAGLPRHPTCMDRELIGRS